MGTQDLLLRTQIQGAVWKSVTMLRYGKYFDCSSNDFDVAINNCKINAYNDTPDFLSIGDEASIVRRLLSSFALRPTVIKTTIVPSHNLSYPLRPEGSGIDIRVESAPMLTFRLGFFNNPQQAQAQLLAQGQPQTQQQSNRSIKDVLKSQQYVYDRETRMVVPSFIEVIYSRNVLIINIPRRNYRIDYRNLVDPGATWHTLPRVFAGIDQANLLPVDVPEVLDQVGEGSGGDDFNLTSAILINTHNLGSGEDPNSKPYIVGYSALLKVENTKTTTALNKTEGTYFEYNPKSMFDSRPDGVINPVQVPVSGMPGIPADLYGLPIGEYTPPDGKQVEDILNTQASILFYKAENQAKQPKGALVLAQGY